ncbi:MAG: DUF4398 domain-containing protein [Candidatus Acidiferrales bacterium]
MNRLFLTISLAAASLALAATTPAQCPPQQPQPEPQQPQQMPPPAARATQVREVLAIKYPESESVEVRLRGTERLPTASGEAHVERQGTNTEINLNLDEMKAASRFGGDFNTYVLWTISPEGKAASLGEVILEGNSADLEATTPLNSFALIITAEPHFAVHKPSHFVVLESIWPTEEGVLARVWPGKPHLKAELFGVEYEGFQREYAYDWETLTQAPEPRTTERSEMAQARTAIELAERAGADQQQLARARQKFDEAQKAAAAADSDENDQARDLAREAVLNAAEAQRMAEESSPAASRRKP